MCRSIKVLRNAEAPATDEEIEAAALQFVHLRLLESGSRGQFRNLRSRQQ